MKIWVAAFGALCVFIALLASPGGAEVARWPSIDPASRVERTPDAKPDQNADASLPEGFSIVRQCAASTIFAKVVDAQGTRAFHARYSRTAFDEMLGAGCTRIQQGCNACMVSYVGCTARQRAACTDGDCLARVCERRMVCTSKSCVAYGDKAPPCKARFVRHACLESAFGPLDSGAASRE